MPVSSRSGTCARKSGGAPMIKLTETPIEGHEVSSEIARAREGLADLRLRYDREREGIEKWVGPEVAKRRLLQTLEKRHGYDRDRITGFVRALEKRRSADYSPKATDAPISNTLALTSGQQ